MFIIKLLGRILLIPIWIVLAILTIAVSGAVRFLGFTRGISGIVLGLLLISTLICYHDLLQAVFLIAGIMIGYLLMFSGVAIEVLLETARDKVGKMIWA